MAGPEATAPHAMRSDIQALRGVAVLAVLAYHALPEVAARGFLGVDVFFVISGFLIGGIILRGLEARTFRFGSFYLRRAWRLLPASFATLAVTTLLAYPFLTHDQWRDYLGQLVGALTFTANIFLAAQSGYFEHASAAKPLLHIWSLSLEEQFYFVAPAILALVGLRYRMWLLVAGAALSAALCFAFVSGFAPGDVSAKRYATLAFFLLPTRAWELLLGAMAAWIMLHRPINPHPYAKWTALAAVVALLVFSLDEVHPRLDALVVCVATAVMLLGRGEWLRLRPLETVGDWSYSLYLVHWPLLAFAHAAWLDTPPLSVRLGLLALAFLLAWLQFRFVETPFRHGWKLRRFPLGLVAAGGAVALIGLPGFLRVPPAEQVTPAGLSERCDQPGSAWQDLAECRTSERPTTALWGDSYAMQFVPALEGRDFVQLTKSACAPLPGVANIGGSYPIGWARECAAFNDSVLKALLASDIQTVIISSPFTQVLEDSGQDLLVDGRREDWSLAGRRRLLDTVERLRAAGKQVTVIGPTPSDGSDIGACNARRAEGRVLLGRRDCDIDKAMVARAEASVRPALLELREAGVTVVLPGEVLCRRERCITALDGRSLYRDRGHLTPEGAAYVLGAGGQASSLPPH